MISGRPLTLRVTPLWLRQRLFYRLYSSRADQRPDLFVRAPLAFSPEVRLQLVASDVAHAPIAWTGVYELAVTRRLMRFARGGGTLLDVGANWGYYSCLWASVGPGNGVVSFEASPRNWDGLQGNVRENGLDARVRIEQVAVGKENSEMYFDEGPIRQTGWGRLTVRATGRRVPVVNLDTYCQAHAIDHVSVLKIDVEGADTWVVEGAVRMLAEGRIAVVFFEEEPERMHELGVEAGRCARLLRRLGYRVRRIAPGEFMATRAP